MPQRAIFFDCFRTLFEVGDLAPMMRAEAPHWREAVTAVLEQAAAQLPDFDAHAFLPVFEEVTRTLRREAVASGRERHVEERFALALARFGYPPERQRRYAPLLAEAQRRQLLLHCRPFPGVAELLAELARRFRLAVVSNFDDPLAVHQLLERFELARMVSAVVVSADIGWRKPRPEIFRAALERTGLAPQDVVFVGDSWEEDVLGAAALGMATVWIDPGASPGPIAEEPRGWVIPQIQELRSVSFVAAD